MLDTKNQSLAQNKPKQGIAFFTWFQDIHRYSRFLYKSWHPIRNRRGVGHTNRQPSHSKLIAFNLRLIHTYSVRNLGVNYENNVANFEYTATIQYFFDVLYSSLLHLPPLRFHYVGGCWDRNQDCCDFGTGSQML